MSYVKHSTHFNNWIFTPEELERIHRLRQLKARKALRLEHEQRVVAAAKTAPITSSNGTPVLPPRLPRKPRSFAALVPVSSTAVQDSFDWNDAIDDLDLEAEEQAEEKLQLQLSPLLETLTLEQERILQAFYEVKIQESCSQLFRTPDKVKCAAVMLYKRFYLSNSVMEFHPKYIVPTAIYVAGKVEEQYMSVDTIADQLHVDHKHIIGHEMILLEGLRFQLIMSHPFRALMGFLDDFRAFYKSRQGQDLPNDVLQKLYANSCVVVNDLLLSEVPLTNLPAYLALAALCRVADELASDLLSKSNVLDYVRHSKFSQNEDVDAVERKLAAVDTAYDALTKTKQSEEQDAKAAKKKAKEVKIIYKKLKQFHDDDEGGGKDKDKKKDEKKRKSSSKEGKKEKKAKK